MIERLQLRTKKMERIIPQDKRVSRFVSSPIRAIIEKYDQSAVVGQVNAQSAQNILIGQIEDDQARRSVNFQIIAEQKEEIEQEVPIS